MSDSWDFADLVEGPPHECHGEQTQVGWIGHKGGDFYPWNAPPSEDQEPGGFTPCYIDNERE